MYEKTVKMKEKLPSNAAVVIKNFFNDFFSQSGIHGFLYFANQMALNIIERLFWFGLIGFCVYFCVDFALENWDRYLHRSTVITIERDHYFWNTSLPSITICPMERLNKEQFEEFCDREGISSEEERKEFFKFLESLANSTFSNFENIVSYPSTNGTLEKLKIKPEHYMSLIYNLTENLTLKPRPSLLKVRTIHNLDFIRTVQTLTEFGICYTTNNFLAPNLSTSWLIDKEPLMEDLDYKDERVHDVRFGNVFDGDLTYSFVGFDSAITVFLHSPFEFMNIARGLPWSELAYEFQIYSIEIVTSDDFKSTTTVSQRKCRFSDESNLAHFDIYTKGICLMECRIKLAMDKCGCIPHFYPNTAYKPKPVCHYQILKNCFPRWKQLFLEFHDSNKSVVTCSCLQNCLDSNVIVEKFQTVIQGNFGGKPVLLDSIGGLVIIKKYPLIRYQREVIFTFTDFLVAIGGTAGLFTGISVLGLVELIYYFSLRLLWFLRGFGRD